MSMKFDKSRIYTALNADELKVGSTVFVSDDLSSLKESLSDFRLLKIIERVESEKCKHRFLCDDGFCYAFAYLVEEPNEQKLVALTKESSEIRAQFDSLIDKKNSSISYFAYKDCDNEQQFKMSIIKYIFKNIFDCVFCIETEETVQGFPDVMCLYQNLNGGTSALFYEFKYSNKSGKIKFQPTQPAFYKKYENIMQIIIVAYDQRTKMVVKFDSSCLFDKESPYYMNEKAEVQL